MRLLAQAVDATPGPGSLSLLAELETANPLWRQRTLDHYKEAVTMEPRLT